MRLVYNSDYHIHSKISLCSNDPEQTAEAILHYAKDMDLKEICVTNHFWDDNVPGASEWYAEQNFDHIAQIKPLPSAEGIRFMFGCETELDKHHTLGISRETFDEFDFVIIPTTHLHMVGFTVTEEDVATPKDRAETWVKRLEAVLNMDLPFRKIGIAHLACPLIARGSRAEYLETLSLIDESAMRALFTKAAKLGVGIELNGDDMSFKDEETDTVLKMFRIAKECGCKFYFGTDAHHPKELYSPKPYFERAIELLGLTEDDRFIIC